jgi:uncharacterized protein (DUF1684 family)
MMDALTFCRNLLAIALLMAASAADNVSYRQSVEQWRKNYEAYLTADDGWLTVCGLLWLHEGRNTFGSARGNDVVLPAPVPAHAGYFDLQAGKTVVHVNPGVLIMMGGKPVETADLASDSKTDRLKIGDLTFYVHQNAGRYGIRLKDKNCALRKQFTGLHWFPVNQRYQVTARFIPYSVPRKVRVEIIDGNHDTTVLAGYLEFQLSGKKYRLEAEKDEETGGLSIVFRDLTSKTQTYQAARFLDTAAPINGMVELDFNKAYNPPCAYNPYSTCPLPTAGNRLPIEIPAGEKRYH